MSKLPIVLSINPWYFCNFDCNFCYLTPSQLNDKKLLDLNLLKTRINEIEELFEITLVDIYGGEIALLPKDYFDSLIRLFKTKSIPINLITNLSMVSSHFLDESVELSVSWDGDLRRRWQDVYRNLSTIGRDVHILMLASKEMISWSEAQLSHIISMLNQASTVKSVEIKPYSTNQANQFRVSHLDYENFVKRWFSYSREFIFVNEENLKGVFSGESNSFSDNHLYITPKGEFSVLDFDEFGHEYFKAVNTISDYLEWSNLEKIKAQNNLVCNNCEYQGVCLTEHLRDVKSKEDSCNGYHHLIKWYQGGMNAGL